MSATDTAERYDRIPLDQIAASSTNPRTHLDPVALEELVTSIRDKGVVQPILVRPKAGARNGHTFEIVAGERRVKASRLAEQKTIPAIIRELSDAEVLELQLIENIQRRDLTPLEQARGFRRLIDTNPDKHSAESIARRIGMSAQWVWDRMKLNDLIPEAKRILEAGRMTVGHAILIARLKPADQQRTIDVEDGAEYGGLFEGEDAKLFEPEGASAGAKADKYAGLKTRSVRELESWIHDHIRFDLKHAGVAQPLQFETAAAEVAAKAAESGRGKKVIAITRDHFTRPEARDEDERTYSGKSWKRADGTKKTTERHGKLVDSPACEHAVRGVVVTGPGQGEQFDVCIARDRCEVHWKAEIAERTKAQKLRAQGKTGAAAQREAKVAEANAREQRERQAREDRWQVFYPALRKAVTAAVGRQPNKLPRQLFAALVKGLGLPANTKAHDLQRALLAHVIARQFTDHAWYGHEPQLVGWAKVLKVDVKACEPQTSREPAKPAAKATR